MKLRLVLGLMATSIMLGMIPSILTLHAKLSAPKFKFERIANGMTEQQVEEIFVGWQYDGVGELNISGLETKFHFYATREDYLPRSHVVLGFTDNSLTNMQLDQESWADFAKRICKRFGI
jgi:hypothetical protein